MQDQIQTDSSRPIPVDDRRCGNTTRLVDYYIQQLFTHGVAHIRDHHPGRNADKLLMQRVLRRLEYEHELAGQVDLHDNKITLLPRQ